MNLPAEYLNRMQKRLGEGFPAFLRAMEQPPLRGVRANTLKLSPAAFAELFPHAGEPVSWENAGFYTDAERLGAFPAHHAGLFYAQEPSAMCAAPLLDARPEERVLDLCAAPGGKTTQLAAAMGGEGILIANEYVYDRARILSQNVERLGVKNCAVVSADPAALARRFPAYFDKILVDAPCSGEGMFRKDENAIAEWSEENVARCAVRQAAILDEAAAMLRGGGRLVYSTCTFERAENEGQIEAFLARHAEFTLIREEMLFPHEVRGEGHFAALLEKSGAERGNAPAFSVRRNAAAEKAYAAFAREFFVRPPAGRLTTLDDGRMYLLPEAMPALPVRTLRVGIELGAFDGRRFTPAHALAMAVTKGECARFLTLSEGETEKYLRGETFPTDAENGWCVVGYGDYPLGLGKIAGGILKNHYPKGLRRQ